jgi:hypothetical protein
MASPNQIREMMHAQPFRAFTVHLVAGRSYYVRHPDFIAISADARHRDLTIYDDAGMHLIDLNLVVEHHPAPEPAQSGS